MAVADGVTLEEAVARWRGEGGWLQSCWSVSMGGLGPGYEQCIQIGVFEGCRHILRDLGGRAAVPPSERREEAQAFIDSVVSWVDTEYDLGLSGAQGGAIGGLIYAFCIRGYAETLQVYEDAAKKNGRESRLIQVSRTWPGAKTYAKEMVLEKVADAAEGRAG